MYTLLAGVVAESADKSRVIVQLLSYENFLRKPFRVNDG